MNISDEEKKKVTYDPPQEFNTTPLDSNGELTIKINDDISALIKMKESEKEIKKWLKI